MNSSQFSRIDRISESMQRKLAQIIQQEIQDPRLPKLITISAVKVSKDLSIAKIYFTVFNGDHKLVAGILNNASSFLRTALAKSLTLRIVPQLHFIFDESIEYGQRLSRLIKDANEKDA